MQTVKAAFGTDRKLVDLGRRLRESGQARERDALIYEVVCLYRATADPQAWAILLVELGEALAARVNRFRSPGALHDRDDMAQEMAIAVHTTALTIPLSSPDYLERRLVLRSANRVSRLLKQEWARQQDQDPLEVLERDEEDECEDC